MIFDSFAVASSFVIGSSYLLIFLAMCIEGPILAVAAAFAASLGFFNIWIIFVLSFLGDVIGDAVHYLIGYTGRYAVIKKYQHKLESPFIRNIEHGLKNHLGKTLFLIKFIPFLTSVGLVLAGVLRAPFKKFVVYSAIVTLPRTIFFICLGYYFGVAFDRIASYITWGQYICVTLLILIVVGMYFAFKYISKKAEEKVQEL